MQGNAEMLIYSALLGSFGTILIFQKCRIKQAIGYCMISYSMNLMIILSNPEGGQLTQGLILTSIVISLGFVTIMLHKK